MTYVEFGLQLRQIFPQLAQVPLNNEDLAQYFLNLYPQYYDAISPAARRIKEISERRPESSAWLESSRVENVAGMIANNRAEAMALHEMDMLVKASGMDIPVTALHDIAVNTHQTDELVRLEEMRHQLKLDEYQKTAHIDLDAADRKDLSSHYQLAYLDRQLSDLYGRRARLELKTDRASKDQLTLVNRRIKMLEDDFGAREQTLVQNSDRTEFPGRRQETDSPTDSPATTEGTVEPVPVERNRVGF